MVYSFKEIFLTLQGEGGQAGRVAVFARFAGCNLWSGREQDRATAACTFCDTDFVGVDGDGGGKFDTPETVVAALDAHWGGIDPAHKSVVFTGGEPLLQLDAPLIAAVKTAGYFIAVESNGTVRAPDGIDWLCISPKGENRLHQTSGQELKLVWPQDNVDPAEFAHLDFERFFLQPKDPLDQSPATRVAHTQAVIDYCLAHPQWRMSVQTHKVVGIR
ncbi:7-carboxy-7-deazaguanine synthase [Asticcacaulis sp. AND118]|uniref:7-carboxy-7-deazaguanine synthase n=1 Tax=Asticcacaulis sp. AND118 TaxID=2840468 RepID=UPI001CFFE284|nr:7-carboxy-7-deazaguanine synthase [Asticcacaulis sp. AND118]UDF02534.1 7-carboxy-7-deazaguanine synthase [Asticcacaulis sp. AND118]